MLSAIPDPEVYLKGSRQAENLYIVPLSRKDILSTLLSERSEHSFITFNIFQAKGPIRTTLLYRSKLLRIIGVVLKKRSALITFGDELRAKETDTVRFNYPPS